VREMSAIRLTDQKNGPGTSPYHIDGKGKLKTEERRLTRNPQLETRNYFEVAIKRALE
jgi:hypothetical protein